MKKLSTAEYLSSVRNLSENMFVTVTSLKLRKLWGFFRMSYLSMHVVRQTKQQKGFVSMQHTGFGYLHFTLSAWESEEDIKNFARSGAHLAAMKVSRSLSSEIRIYTFQAEEIPNWKDAKQLLFERGKILSF